jgi:hypothetical protein
MIWSVPKTWEGETVFILAGGPSLKGFDASVLKGKGRVITINDSWRMMPKADIHYFTDKAWWTDQIARNYWVGIGTTGQINFHDLIYKGFWVCGGSSFEDHPQVHQLKFTGQIGLETYPAGLRHGSNSGYAAINLAYLTGAKRIVLLGYDMHCIGQRTHWHNNSPHTAAEFDGILKHSMLPLFNHLGAPLAQAGVEVINATPDSALKCWPHVPLEEVLTHFQPVAAQPHVSIETV